MECFNFRKALICWVDQSLLDQDQRLGDISCFPIICGAIGNVVWGHDVWHFYAAICVGTIQYHTTYHETSQYAIDMIFFIGGSWLKIMEEHGTEVQETDI